MYTVPLAIIIINYGAWAIYFISYIIIVIGVSNATASEVRSFQLILTLLLNAEYINAYLNRVS